MVTAAWSCVYVNIISLTGKLVKFADDTNMLRFGGKQDSEKLQMHHSKLCESLRQVSGGSAFWVVVGREIKRISIFSTRGKKSNL